MNENKSTRYHRLRRRSGLVAAAAAAALQIGVLLGGAATLIGHTAGRLAEQLTPQSALVAWAVVALAVTALAVAHEALVFPFACYRGFLLERRYGLSRESFGTWAGDHLKGSAVGLVFALAGSGIVYSLMRSRPADWWWPAAIIFALATVGLVHLAPIALLPIFYRLRPLSSDTLSARLQAMASRAGMSIVGVYEWSLSERSRRANAALVGVGRTRRILVSDTLLAEYSEDEVEAVLAHELGHHAHRDIWRSLVYDAVVIALGLWATAHALRSLGPRFGLDGPADPAGLPIVVLTVGLVSALQAPVANALSRHHERRADRFALTLTAKPAAFASAMRRLAAQNLAEEDPSRLVQVLFYTHPPIRERMALAAAFGAPPA